MRSICALLGIVMLGSLGCASIKTTVLDRCEGGQLATSQRPVKGVPVMLRVPTHLDVKVVQVDYWRPNRETGDLERLENQLPSRYVDTEIQETEKMFFVDPKRVASGSGIYGFKFNSADGDANAGKGYLSGVSYKADDTTLAESAALFGNITRIIAQATGAAEDNQAIGNDLGLIATKSTIAFCKFDINSPYIEDDVRDFCNHYLNDCNPGCEEKAVVYPENNIFPPNNPGAN